MTITHMVTCLVNIHHSTMRNITITSCLLYPDMLVTHGCFFLSQTITWLKLRLRLRCTNWCTIY